MMRRVSDLEASRRRQERARNASRRKPSFLERIAVAAIRHRPGRAELAEYAPPLDDRLLERLSR